VKKADSDYEWYQKTSFEGENTTEIAQIGGKQYQKISVPGQSETQWVEASSTGFAVQDLLRTLFENEIVEADIADSKVEDKEGGKEYTLTMNDAYAERIKSRNVEELQQSIDELKQDNEESQVIEGIETLLKEIEETNYQGVTITYEINEEGFLTAVHSESTVVPPAGESYTMVSSSSLTEYNLSDTGDLLPQIAE
jgi:HD superfamily phosphohydrolase